MATNKHPHAENMLLYVQDAMTTDRPWELWETRLPLICDEWGQLSRHPAWHPEAQYRRKPRMVVVNGFEYPEPERMEPAFGQVFWVASPFGKIHCYSWNGCLEGERLLSAGAVHLNREAAEAHSRAIVLAGGGKVWKTS